MKKKKFFLFCPGPVNIAKNVKKVVYDYDIGHREREFSEVLEDINHKILKLVKIKNTNKYQFVFINGSSTAANESTLSTLLNYKKKILILRNGEFSDRLYFLSKNYSKFCYSIDFGWANKFNLKKIEEFIVEKKIDILALVHHETSTGMLNNVEEIGRLKKQYNFILILDAVSSIGAENIEMEKWNIDFLTGTTTKAIGALPGTSFVIGKKEIFEKLKNLNVKITYLNLWKYYYYMVNYKQTPNTPSVYSVLSLNKALDNILKIGLDNYYQMIRKRAEKLRNFFKKIGTKFLIEEKDMSSVLTTLFPPEGFTVKKIMDELRKNNIIVYNGKGPYKDKLFQVANIGDLKDKDINYFIKVFKRIIKKS